MTDKTPSWSLSRKVVVRFLFIVLGGSTLLCWDVIADLIFRYIAFGKYSYEAPYKVLIKPFYWLDRHIFHTGYDPKVHLSFPGDNHFGILFYLTLLLAGIVGTIAWSWLDRKRPHYRKLMYWFRVYLRYMLALTMFDYGIDKMIPVQMSYPNVLNLLTPLGESGRFNVLWNFMGISPGYMMLTGIVEITGSLLLFNRRTVVAGCLIELVVLVNVVALNIFYNIPVKLFSEQLLLYTLFLLLPYFYPLIRLFLFGKTVKLAAPQYRFLTPWKRYTLIAFLIGLPTMIFIPIGLGISQRYTRNKANAGRQRIYEITSFVTKDTLAPLLTDTLRWKRLLFVYSNYSTSNYAVIFDMQDNKEYYGLDLDSNKNILTLKNGLDTAQWNVFNYSQPARNQLLLNGKWERNEVHILMKSLPIDSIPINRERIRWVRD
jgi:hypothetical protein